jgi:spore germination protein KC
MAAAFDKKEGNRIELSVQIFIPRSQKGGGGSGMGGGEGGGGGGGKATLVRSAEGMNIADAVARLQGKVPRKISWGHCKVYIFGEELAKAGVSEEVDFFHRQPEIRTRAYMYVSKEKASKVLEVLPPLERDSGEVIRELSKLRLGMETTIFDMKQMLRGEGRAAVLPMVDILNPRNGEKELETAPYLFGTAVFKKDKMIGMITQSATRGVMWLRNEFRTTTVTVKEKEMNGFFSVNQIRATTKLIPKMEQGKWKMHVKVRAEGDMVQNGTVLNPMTPEILDNMEKAVKDDIKNQIELALGTAQKKMKADIFGFAKEFHRKYPKQWNKVKDQWDDFFPKVEVTIDVEANIRSLGASTIPAGIPEQEVKQK